MIGSLIFLAIFSDVFWFWGISELIEEVVMPLIVAGIVASIFFRGSDSKTSAKTVKTTTKETAYRYSSKEKNVQEKLKRYFAENDYLYLSNDVYLKKNTEATDIFQAISVYFSNLEVSSFYDMIKNDNESYMKLIDYFYLQNRFEAEVEQKEEVKMAEYYIEKVNEYNVSIDHSEISNNLYITASLLTTLKTLEAEGLQINDERIRKVYQYYLPMLMEILENYCKTKDNYLLEKEVKETESKLVDIVGLTNEALKNTLSSINEEDIINMKINMSTLESVLKGDGVISDLDKVRDKVQ